VKRRKLVLSETTALSNSKIGIELIYPGMIFLLLMFLQPATGQTLGLLVEQGEIAITKSRTENRASISFELKITQTEVLSSFSSLKTLATEWKNLQCFVGESPLRDNLYQALDPDSNQLEPLQSKYMHFLHT
jgi:hypothetical protein